MKGKNSGKITIILFKDTYMTILYDYREDVMYFRYPYW